MDDSQFSDHAQAHPTAYHRERVRKRAAQLTRRRRIAAGAMGMAAASLIVGALSVSALTPTNGRPESRQALAPTTSRRTAQGGQPSATTQPTVPGPTSTSPTSPKTTSPTTGGQPPTTSGTLPPSHSEGGGSPPTQTQPGDSGSGQAGASTPGSPPTTRPAPAGADERSGESPSTTTTPPPPTAIILSSEPSGTTQSVGLGTPLTIGLSAPPDGTWGTATVSGDASALTIQGQSTNADGSIVVSVTASAVGTATISVPCVGDATDTWTVTIVVAGGQSTGCSGGTCPS